MPACACTKCAFFGVIVRPSKILAAGLCVVAAAACSSDKAKPKTSQPVTTTAVGGSSATSTTVALATGPIAPLTGLHSDDAVETRPALTVKIENTPEARPQSGVEHADVVYEEVAEGGITRLAAIFQSDIPAVIGPVRSVRRTDREIVGPVQGIFVYSGGAKYAEQSIATASVVRFNETSAGLAMFRDHGRQAPHNLYLRAPDIFAKAASAVGPPPPLFHYGAASAQSRRITSCRVGFLAGFAVTWNWDVATKHWQRFIFGRRDIGIGGANIDAVNVVVQAVHYQGGAGVIGAEAQLTGSGKVWVLTRGRVVEGSWTRSTPSSPGQLLDTDGKVIKLARGNTFVELPDTKYAVTIS